MISVPNSRCAPFARIMLAIAAGATCPRLHADTLDATAAPAVESSYHAPEAPSELLRVDAPIRDYFGARLRGAGTDFDRLRQLVGAILEPDGLGFVYAQGDTADVRETFRRRRGNCVSYAFLILAVAREFGFDAKFQLVERDALWDRIGDVVIAARHLDVLVTIDSGSYVLDPEPGVAVSSRHVMRVIADKTAFSQFYCNTGVEHLVRGERAAAQRYLTLATEIDPRYGAAWTNLATFHARVGELGAAKADFERALKFDVRGEVALDGYVTVLQQLGTPEDLRRAGKLERRARAVRDRNPYRQQADALQAERRGDLATAEKLLRHAIRLKDDEPEFYLQWSMVLQRLGRIDDAQRAVAKLEKLRTRLAAAPHTLLH